MEIIHATIDVLKSMFNWCIDNFQLVLMVLVFMFVIAPIKNAGKK